MVPCPLPSPPPLAPPHPLSSPPHLTSLPSPHSESYSQLFAYQYKPKHGEMVKRSSGWALYDSASEYHRMGVPNKYWKDTTINANYEVHNLCSNKNNCSSFLHPPSSPFPFSFPPPPPYYHHQLCDTYSKHLYIPATADVSTVRGSCKFRSKGRLPVLSLFYEPKQVLRSLCRLWISWHDYLTFPSFPHFQLSSLHFPFSPSSFTYSPCLALLPSPSSSPNLLLLPLLPPLPLIYMYPPLLPLHRQHCVGAVSHWRGLTVVQQRTSK